LKVLEYILYILIFIIAYEIIRGLIVGFFKKKLTTSVNENIQENKIRVDKYKFTNKIVVRNDLMNDADINRLIIEVAKEKKIPIAEVKKQAESYIDEIVPFFNILTYYKFGYIVANFVLNFIYEVIIDKENAEKLKKIPESSVVVFVMNHRSNIDYILVAYMLAREISLSYAVGEWARVWPLEYIFKSFGAYFIRRKCKDSLYHLVLEKYIQHISLRGVTQGIFFEGGLTRDGKFKEPKLGIIDYIARIKNDPKFRGEIVFVPASINYDWILEDRILIEEWKKGKEKSGFRDNFKSLIKIIFETPIMAVVNLIRYFAGRLKQHGSASVSFGDPVYLSDFLKKQSVDVLKLDRDERMKYIKEFSNTLQEKIQSVMPITPVPLISKALLSLNRKSLKKIDLVKKVDEYLKILSSKNSRVVRGKAFVKSMIIEDKLKEEKDDRMKGLVEFEEGFIQFEEAYEIVRVALDLLKIRKIVNIKNKEIVINELKKSYLEYYANSLENLV
jgi:glycerol-3-phosphate O-acyltransferase